MRAKYKIAYRNGATNWWWYLYERIGFFWKKVDFFDTKHQAVHKMKEIIEATTFYYDEHGNEISS